MEITWDGLFKGLKCIVLCNYYSLIDFVAVLKELIPTRWTWRVHVLQNSNGNWEGNTYHYINPGGSFGKPVLTSFCLGLPFCKMWLVGFPTVFRIFFDLWYALQLCEVFYYFVLHAASSPHSPLASGDGEGTLSKSLCRLFGGVCREHDSVPLHQPLVLWCHCASARLIMLFRHSRMCLKCTCEHYEAHILDLSTQIPCNWSLPSVLSFSFSCLLFSTCVLGLLCGCPETTSVTGYAGTNGWLLIFPPVFVFLHISVSGYRVLGCHLGVLPTTWPLSDAHVAPMSQWDCVLFACLKKGLGKWWRRKTVSRLWVDRSSWEWSHLSIRPALTLSASLMDWSMPAFVLSTSPWKMSSKAR